MAKKKIENNYPIEDLSSMLKLFQHVGPFRDEQQHLIHLMAKKYLDPNHPKPIASCNCNLSYGSVFNKLRDWVSENGKLFS